MDITPASFAQVVKGRNGQLVEIERDVLDIAKQIQEVDPQLRLRWNEAGGYFVIAQVLENGDEHLVTTAQTLDQRVLEKCRKLVHPDYDLADELEKADAAVEAAHDRKLHDEIGEHGERLQHALRGVVEDKHRIYVPGWCR